jgi:hypothetical protein
MRSTYWPLRGGEIDREMGFLYEVEKKWVEEGACGDVWFKMYMKYGPTTTRVLRRVYRALDLGPRIRQQVPRHEGVIRRGRGL